MGMKWQRPERLMTTSLTFAKAHYLQQVGMTDNFISTYSLEVITPFSDFKEAMNQIREETGSLWNRRHRVCQALAAIDAPVVKTIPTFFHTLPHFIPVDSPIMRPHAD